MLTAIDNIFPWFGDMLELGGDILLVILFTATLIGIFVAERLAYLFWSFPRQRNQALALWQAHPDPLSWKAQQFRRLLISRLSRNLVRNIDLTRTLIKLCPLLGLLGTVLGMVEVFDAVAATGSNSPRATAAGVSKATVTTMAGMVVAIASMLFCSVLSRRLNGEKARLADFLPYEGTAEENSRD